MDNSLVYIDTRLNILSVGNVFLAETMTQSIVEVKNFYIILDNEVTKEETKVKLNNNEYTVLKDFFVSTHGKKLRQIDIEAEDNNLLCCLDVPNLEDESMFVTIEEVYDKEKENIVYSMTLTDKAEGKYSSVELSEEAYIVFHDMRVNRRK